MRVHVRVLNGPFFDLSVEASATVGDLRAAMGAFLREGPAGQRMAFESRQLDVDERMLVSYGVTEGSTVVVYGP